MTAIRRAYRAEALLSARDRTGEPGDPANAESFRELMTEIAEIKQLIRPVDELGEHMIEKFKSELGEAVKLKAELDAIYDAIGETKREIATLHRTTGSDQQEMCRVTDELDAVVLGTEGATENILASAEYIDETANVLSARLKGQDQQLVNDIQERVIQIFENCNFQDLTGQRITKVVAAMRFIEERIVKMMEIWGGIESFKEIDGETMPAREGDAALLNGPALDTDEGVASQDDIDALFA
ncbi:protein phosphatase CheZ [Rhizobiales bacterium]|uniref:protein phosphatase CheZ n=1 Tax=Hongsoonwoonella zoysiae TaxID=2821844 RepID=UPI0015606931|nr:protein phosphatase CheZ [Hongsoonwoonella zoysiae]NRG19873.1 protein phosphatase CheZ [Hongsoonwoonella zoysiae]